MLRKLKLSERHRKSVGFSGMRMRRNLRKNKDRFAKQWLDAAIKNGTFIRNHNQRDPFHFHEERVLHGRDPNRARFYHTLWFQLPVFFAVFSLVFVFPWIWAEPLWISIGGWGAFGGLPMGHPGIVYVVTDLVTNPFQTQCGEGVNAPTCMSIYGPIFWVDSHPFLGNLIKALGFDIIPGLG